MPKSQRSGFTLIELLVVIGVLAILLTITLIAINPARQFSQSNDTKRSSDINALLNAVQQYAADHHGELPPGMTGVNPTPLPIKLTDPLNPAPTTEAELCTGIVTDYMAALPVDPLVNNGTPVTVCDTAYDTGYLISKSDTNNRITVSAPRAEINKPITVTR